MGSFVMFNLIFDELSFQIFEKNEKWKIVSFRKSKNSQIQKVDFFFEKSMSPHKILRIVLRSFLLLNDQDRNDSVFSSLAAAERSEVRAKRGPNVRIRPTWDQFVLPKMVLPVLALLSWQTLPC